MLSTTTPSSSSKPYGSCIIKHFPYCYPTAYMYQFLRHCFFPSSLPSWKSLPILYIQYTFSITCAFMYALVSKYALLSIFFIGYSVFVWFWSHLHFSSLYMSSCLQNMWGAPRMCKALCQVVLSRSGSWTAQGTVLKRLEHLPFPCCRSRTLVSEHTSSLLKLFLEETRIFGLVAFF